MSEANPSGENEPATSLRATTSRAVKIAILVVGLVLGVASSVALLSGGDNELAFEYRGFD